MAEVDFIKKDLILTVLLKGEIDHHGANSVREKIDNEILKMLPKIVVMDFSKVGFMDSSGIGLVLARHRLCKEIDANVYVGEVNEQTQRVLALAGIKTIKKERERIT